MASNDNKWQPVKSSKKVTKAQSKSNNKSDKALESVSFEEVSGYDAFLEREKKILQESLASSSNSVVEPKLQKKKLTSTAVAKKKQKPRNKLNPSTSLELACRQVSAEELKSIIGSSRAQYENNPSIWFRDMASFLDTTLSNVEQISPYFQEMDGLYPANYLPPDVRSVINSTLAAGKEVSLKVLLEFCLSSTMKQVSAGKQAWGYQIVLQLLLRQRPDLLLSSIDYVKELKVSANSNTRAMMALLWYCAQTSHDFSTGLRVWVQLALPALGVRNIAPYVVSNLRSLLLQHPKAIVPNKDIFSASNVIMLLKACVEGDCVASVRDDLRKLYPSLKPLILDPHISHAFFDLLAFLSPGRNSYLDGELLVYLSRVLASNDRILTQWENSYNKYLKQNRFLVQHIVAAMKSREDPDMYEYVFERIRPYLETTVDSSELRCHIQPSHTVSGSCRSYCTVRGFLRLLSALFFLAVVVAGVEIFLNAGYSGSQSEKFVQSFVSSPYIGILRQQISRVRSVVTRWLELYLPTPVLQASETIANYCLDAFNRSKEFVCYVMKETAPFRSICCAYGEKIVRPVITSISLLREPTRHYLNCLHSALRSYGNAAYNTSHSYYIAASIWIHDKVPQLVVWRASVWNAIERSIIVSRIYGRNALEYVTLWWYRMADYVSKQLLRDPGLAFQELAQNASDYFARFSTYVQNYFR